MYSVRFQFPLLWPGWKDPAWASPFWILQTPLTTKPSLPLPFGQSGLIWDPCEWSPSWEPLHRCGSLFLLSAHQACLVILKEPSESAALTNSIKFHCFPLRLTTMCLTFVTYIRMCVYTFLRHCWIRACLYREEGSRWGRTASFILFLAWWSLIQAAHQNHSVNFDNIDAQGSLQTNY